MSTMDDARHEIALRARAVRAFAEGNSNPQTRSICPHCGVRIELMADVNGKTVVIDAQEVQVALPYPSGYVRVKMAHLIHSCPATGEGGHVVR